MTEEHRHHSHAPGTRSVSFAVLTTTDSRTEKDDETGRVVREILTRAGHRVLHTGLSENSVPTIQGFLRTVLKDPETGAVVTTGGTGVGRRDVTVDAIEGLAGRRLDGFGERFRALSFNQVGVLSLMSRSALYVVESRPVFALPGSTKACRLALDEIILPLLPHLIEELTRR